MIHSEAPTLPLASGLALIFDLDGVIVDSMPLHTQAWQLYLERLGVNTNGLLSRMHGRRNDEIVRDFLGPAADDRTVFEHGEAKEQLFRELMHDRLHHYLVPGIRQFLERGQAVPIALASNAERANIDFVLDGSGLRPYFRTIVDGSQVTHPKPAPDVFLRAAHELGVAPHNCIVFEDSPVGIASARAAGARVVGIQSHSSPLPGVEFLAQDFLNPEMEEWLSSQRLH